MVWKQSRPRRFATAAGPGGIETEDTDEHAATPDGSVPSAPAVTARIIGTGGVSLARPLLVRRVLLQEDSAHSAEGQ